MHVGVGVLISARLFSVTERAIPVVAFGRWAFGDCSLLSLI